jgi:hypothetical protein
MGNADARALRLAATLACAVLLVAIDGAPALAETPPEAPAGAEGDEAGELAKKLQNPVAALISVPFQSNFEWGGGRHSDGFKYTLPVRRALPTGAFDLP